MMKLQIAMARQAITYTEFLILNRKDLNLERT